MNDREYEEQKQRVMTLVDKWAVLLWLTNWQIDYEWYRAGMKAKPDGSIVPMEVLSHYQYFAATLRVDLSCVIDTPDDRLERMIVHELCHPIVNEMRWWDDDSNHEERVVSHLAQAYYFLERHKYLSQHEANEIYGRWQAALVA